MLVQYEGVGDCNIEKEVKQVLVHTKKTYVVSTQKSVPKWCPKFQHITHRLNQHSLILCTFNLPLCAKRTR